MSIECVDLAEEHIPEVIGLMREYWTWQASQVSTYQTPRLKAPEFSSWDERRVPFFLEWQAYLDTRRILEEEKERI